MLEQLVTKAKAVVPKTGEQYKAMQLAIRDASRERLRLLAGKSGTPEYQQAEMDVIKSSVALMTFFSEQQQADVVTQIHEFLKSRRPLSVQDIQTGMLAAAMLEMQPDKKPSRDTYQLLDQLLEDDEREEMQSLRLILQASMRHLDLLGNKLELEAVALDGSNIKLADYAGKFVVVDFFATWCEPCLAEVPRLKKHFEKYHAKGLEVVGVSLDGDAAALKEFMDRAQLPWPIIHDNAENPLERIRMRLGVSSLPKVLLLNKEGTVVSLEARGSELDRLMQLLFEAPTPAPLPPAPAPPAAAQPAGNPLEQQDDSL